MNAVEIEEAVSALAPQPFDPEEFLYAFLIAFGNKTLFCAMDTRIADCEAEGTPLWADSAQLPCANRHILNKPAPSRRW